MKQVYIIGILLVNILLLSSCKKEEHSANGIEGEWVRSYTNSVWVGENQPLIERGESHITITFNNQGEFTRNRTVFGLYEGTSIADTSAVIIEHGTYTAEDENIVIVLNEGAWWDFYNDMKEFVTSGFTPNKYKDMTYEVSDDELKIEYFIETDDISDQQETLGLDKFEEIFTRQ